MSTLNSLGLLLLRVAIGGMMALHGWQKLEGFEGLAETFPDPLGVGSRTSLMLAIGAELGCSALLIIGLAARLAAIPLAVTMGVALFMAHAADPWKVKELAAVYLAVFVSLFFTGPGWFSIDHLFVRRRRKKAAEKAGGGR